MSDENEMGEQEFDEAEMQALRERIKALPSEIPPNPLAWSNIQRRIESARVRELPTATTAQRDEPSVSAVLKAKPVKWNQQTRVVMLAAASLFVAVTTFTVMRERETPVAAKVSGNTGVTVAATHTDSALVVASATDTGDTSAVLRGPQSLNPPVAVVLAEFSAAALDLTRDLDARRSRLQPEALAVVDTCLQTIDEAIRESRDALKAAPWNNTIVELLQVTYQQKLDLLRRAADLPMASPQE